MANNDGGMSLKNCCISDCIICWRLTMFMFEDELEFVAGDEEGLDTEFTRSGEIAEE